MTVVEKLVYLFLAHLAIYANPVCVFWAFIGPLFTQVTSFSIVTAHAVRDVSNTAPRRQKVLPWQVIQQVRNRLIAVTTEYRG
jgi:hypothetical protein